MSEYREQDDEGHLTGVVRRVENVVESFDVERDAGGRIVGGRATRSRVREDGSLEVLETAPLTPSEAQALATDPDPV